MDFVRRMMKCIFAYNSLNFQHKAHIQETVLKYEIWNDFILSKIKEAEVPRQTITVIHNG